MPCQDWAGSQRPSCHRLAVCLVQAGGLNCSPGELNSLQQGFFQVRLQLEMPALPSALKQSPSMLLCSVTLLSQLCHHHSWEEHIVQPGLTTAGISLDSEGAPGEELGRLLLRNVVTTCLVSTTLTAHTAGHPPPLLKGYTCPCDHTMPHPVGGEGKDDHLSTNQPALHHSRQPPSCSKRSSPLGTSWGPVASDLIPHLIQQAPGQQGKAGRPQTTQLWGLQQLLGTPSTGVSWKPYQALRHSRAVPGLGSQGLGA